MGWTWTNRTSVKNGGRSLKDEVRHICRYTGAEKDHHVVLDVAVVNRTEAYVAYQTKPGEVIALVFLLGYAPNDYHNFGYKDMDESMGPHQYNCPKRILDLLTDPINEWAKQWRVTCRNVLAMKEKAKTLKDGDTVKFSTGFHFTDGGKSDTFQYLKSGRKVRWVRPDGALVRITNWRTRDWEKVQ